MICRKSSGIKFHSSSVLKNPALPEKKSVKSLPTDWILYEEMSRYERSAYIRCCTAVSPVAVALFTGPIRLPAESIRDGTRSQGKSLRETCLRTLLYYRVSCSYFKHILLINSKGLGTSSTKSQG
jgi:hypothetical protein